MQRRIEARNVVALRREEDVAVGILPPQPGSVELLEEQVDDEVERAERGAEVPRTCALHGGEGVCAAHVGDQRKIGLPLAYAVELGLRDQLQRENRRDVIHNRHPVAQLSAPWARTARASAETTGAASHAKTSPQ